MSNQNHALQQLKALNPEQRLHFFELLAHDLTVAIRAVWSEPALTAEDKVEAMKTINECLHRATARIWVERLRTHEWTDEDFIELLTQTDAALPAVLRGSVRVAFNHAIERGQSNKSFESDALKTTRASS
jgi:hypothetical protein